MAYGLSKAVTFVGVTAAGGGVMMGAIIFSDTKEKSITHKENSASVERMPEEKNQHQSSTILPPTQPSTQTTCVIYEANDPGPKPNAGNRKFERLLKRFESKEKFFEEFNSRPPKEGALQSFKQEITQSCRNEGTKKNVNGNVYVWWGTSRGVKTWFYASDMHKETDDWINDPIVKQNSSEVIAGKSVGP